MISKRIPSILPYPSLDEFIEIVRIYSAMAKVLKLVLVTGYAHSVPLITLLVMLD